MDVVHPPFWYAAWGFGLAPAAMALPPAWLEAGLWAMLAGYVLGRLCEGYFIRRFGFSIFVWRRFDSLSRLITARRNPNIILLGLGWLAGRPDIGLLAVVLRSDVRRVGKECERTGRARWSPSHLKTKD